MHDAANILRRYFNQLPEPIIPLDFYERFREPLRNHQQQAVGPIPSQTPDHGGFDADAAIRSYQMLITELPPLNRQLLLYILDLLAVFASKAELNKMNTPNLAAIFQPGLLSHPQHDMAPKEYRLSQDVLIFLIENQDSFLIGMHGTAADEKTVMEVQSGAPAPGSPGSPSPPGRTKAGLGRSSSNASAGAESVHRWGNIRRNVSVSSRGSRGSVGAAVTSSPAIGSPATMGSGMHRSNTVPSRHSAGASPRFTREKSSDLADPSPTGPSLSPASAQIRHRSSSQSVPTESASKSAHLTAPDLTSASSSETATPLANPVSDASSAIFVPSNERTPTQEVVTGLAPPASRGRDASSERSFSGTPTSTSRTFLDIFKQSPNSESERRDGRQPRKLQKKRPMMGDASSAHNSAVDLSLPGDGTAEARGASRDSLERAIEAHHSESAYQTAQSTPRHLSPKRTTTDATLRPTTSPPHSFQSRASMTDTSDADVIDDAATPTREGEKKRRWRFSQATRRKDSEQSGSSKGLTAGNLGTMAGKDRSRSTIDSNGGQGVRSPSSTDYGTSPPEQVFSDSEESKKGPMSWLKNKLAERKEKDAERRSKYPMKRASADKSGSRQSLQLGGPESRGKSVEVPRQPSQPQMQTQPQLPVQGQGSTPAPTGNANPELSTVEEKDAGNTTATGPV